METWKQAFWLTKFELKHSKLNLLFLFGALILLLLLVVPVIPEYLENSSFGLDFTFIITFSIIFQWGRPKVFKAQKINSNLWASHYLMMLHQLPMTKEVMMKYRFLTYLIISIPFQVLFLTVLYMLSPVLQDTLTLSSYFVFSVFWICFNLYIGSTQLLSEVSSNLFLNIILSLFLFGPLFFILFFVAFYKLYTAGLVHWTMYISTNFPVLTTILSLVLAVLGWNYWMYRMRRKMDKVDYLA